MIFRTALLVFLLCCSLPTISQASTRFEAVDVIVDSGETPLAAWQIQLNYDPTTLSIVGIESGNSAYNQGEPPTYDGKGLRSGRIIIAGFGLNKDQLPKGRCYVARLHLEVEGATDLSSVVMAAADANGKKITVTTTVSSTLEKE